MWYCGKWQQNPHWFNRLELRLWEYYFRAKTLDQNSSAMVSLLAGVWK